MKQKTVLIGGGAGVVILLVLGSMLFSSVRGDYRQTAGSSYNKMAMHEEVGGIYAADMVASPEMSNMKLSARGTEEALVQDGLVREPGPVGSPDDEQVAGERLVIKTGTVSMVVENVADSVRLIETYAAEVGGFVVSSNIEKNGVAPSGNITIRIPSEEFDEGYDDVQGLGEVKSKTTSGQDVTAEYVDLDSRLTNLRATEEQFLEIMDRAVKIEDVLAVQNQLTRVRGEIEVIQGRMKYLRESSAMSTLTVYLSTDPGQLPIIEPDDSWKPFATVKEAARNLLYTLQSIGDFFIWIVVYIPLILFYVLIFWIGYRIVRWVYRKLSSGNSAKRDSK